MSDNNITTQSTEKGTKSLFLVFGMVALSFVVMVIVKSLNDYGGFNYFDYPVLVYTMVIESLSGLILFPLMQKIVPPSQTLKKETLCLFLYFAL
jgi:hypothetical protein